MEARSLAQPGDDAATLPAGRFTAFCCRSADLAIATLLLALLLPLLLLIAAAVRLDSSGPALFRQRRVGRGGRPFTVLKFRTMRAAADATPHREYVSALIGGHPGTGADDESTLFKLACDDRVTRLGRVLRRSSLDELPQLGNVILGQMSLVGPRPAIDYEVDRYPAWYLERLSVKPGITGLWQVSGRNERTFEEMVRLDIEYVRRHSLPLYASILLKTPRVVLGRRGVA
jgi:lipopolysaccharide/colanic/teichoic acid biosynthesis glycosyltransferase